jgi:hypothetical protein
MSERSAERQAAFKKIEAAYQSFYKALESNDALPYRSTESGMWAISDAKEAYRAFCHFKLGRYAHLADLGSGDGKVALIGSLFTRVTGYETDDTLHKKSLEIRDQLKLSHASFLRQDYLLADLSPYDILYLYPDKPLYALEARLHPVWHGHLLVNGLHFPPRYFDKIAESPLSVGRFTLYEPVNK